MTLVYTLPTTVFFALVVFEFLEPKEILKSAPRLPLSWPNRWRLLCRYRLLLSRWLRTKTCKYRKSRNSSSHSSSRPLRSSPAVVVASHPVVPSKSSSAAVVVELASLNVAPAVGAVVLHRNLR